MKPASHERTPDGGEHVVPPPNREQLLTVRPVDREDAVVLVVDGEIDGLTAGRLSEAVQAAFDRLAARLLVLDLSAVVFMGSSGLRILRESATEAVRRRGLDQLRVVVDQSRPVIRPIEIVGMDQMLSLFHTVEDALAAGDPR